MIFENIDLAQVMVYLFWIFFAGLLLYLRREDRREGYPLESDTHAGRLLSPSLIFFPAPKTFAMSHGGAMRRVPDGVADTRQIAGVPVARWPGAPLQPTGATPLLDGIGPGAWAERPNTPEMTVENHTKIVPLRVAPAYSPATDGPDPRGYTVIGLDRAVAGTVVDLWIDRSECVLRLLEVELTDAVAGAQSQPTAGTPTALGDAIEAKPVPAPATTTPLAATGTPRAAGGRRVLVPVNFANIHRLRRRVTVKAVLGRQLAMTPQIAADDQITMLEEEKIMAFFGAGMMYATPHRAEPLL